MTDEFEATAAFITGGGSGIGRAAALLLAARGCAVTIADRDVQGGKETVRQVEAALGVATFVECDVADETSVRDAVDAAAAVRDRLDFGINCAGVRGPGMPVAIADYEADVFDQMYAVNLRGTFLCMKYELKHLIKRGTGSIINVASGAGMAGAAGTAGYSASKHGVVGLTKTAALDYAAQSIRINVVSPGLIDTPMNQTGRSPERMAAMVESTPLKRKGEPSEVGTAIEWLCSEKSSFVTGSVICVDGGRAAMR